MNILITGANGQLGRSIKDCMARLKTAHNFIFTDIDVLDITDRQAVEKAVDQAEADMIINCAAYTDVEKAENDYDRAFAINAIAPGILAHAIARRNGAIIHISTDYVFGGNNINTPCREDLPTNPLGVYGSTKLEGEKRVAAECSNHIIIRTAWLYSEYGRNFVRTMIDLTGRLPEVNVVVDQAGSPTYARDLAEAVLAVADSPDFRNLTGIYHFSDEGVCSWFDLATAVAKRVGKGCRVAPCSSDKFPSNVERPSYSVLDKSKIKNSFGIEIPHWTDSLNRCLDNILK